MLGARFENGKQIREAKKLADGLAEIDQLKLALGILGGKVEPHQRPEAGAIHTGKRGEIESDVLFVREHGFDVSLQKRGIFGGEPARAIDEH